MEEINEIKRIEEINPIENPFEDSGDILSYENFAAFEAKDEEQEEEPEQNDLKIDFEYSNQHEEQLSETQIRSRKTIALNKLRKYKQQGHSINSHFNINTDLDVLEESVLLIDREIKDQSTLEFTRMLLLTSVGLIEKGSAIMNSNSPLIGWSEDFNKKINSYDEILLNIYELYGPKTEEWNPIILLILMVTASGTMYSMKDKMNIDVFQAMENLKKDKEGPSDEAMNMFEELNKGTKPKRKYNKKST